MRLKITIQPVDSDDTEEVIASLAVLRKWEQANGRPALKALDEGYVGPILELAAIAHNRKHGGVLDVEAFIDSHDIVATDMGGGTPAHPSDPATVPPSD